jgi:hypothetical protein
MPFCRNKLCIGLLGISLILLGCTASPQTLPTVTLPPAATATTVPTLVPPSSTPTIVPPTAIPTDTPMPTNPPTLTVTPSPTPVPSGQVAEERGGLRIRIEPDTDSWVLGNLPAGTTVSIIGRTGDNAWLEVATTDGTTGWVWGSYLEQTGDLAGVPVTSDVLQPTEVVVAQAPASSGVSNPAPALPAAPPPSNVVSGITGTARQIYLRGQEMGNRAAVFSKVGDSLTVATYVLYPFGWRTYDLQEYSYYQPALDYWYAVLARESADSFGNISLAADNGWTTESILNPALADPAWCQPGETPLACEYRVVKPAVALILIGTNDVGNLSAEAYRANLGQIAQFSIDQGVIPMLTTIPRRAGFEEQVGVFNQIIIETARQFDVPLIDYFTAMLPLPNNGLSSDGVHPSWPPGEYSDTARFLSAHMSYGYTIRNFTALQALDAIWRQALY